MGDLEKTVRYLVKVLVKSFAILIAVYFVLNVLYVFIV